MKESPRSPHSGQYIWTTEDEGASFKSHRLPEGFLIDEIKYHPTEPKWLLGYDRRNRNLWVSTDFATTWKLISSNVTPAHFFWYEVKSDKNEYLTGEKDDFGKIEAKRLVHFETETVEKTPFDLEVDTGVYEFKTCLIPECTSAGEHYDRLNEQSRREKVAENSLIVRDDYIFFERAKGALTKAGFGKTSN